MADNVIVRVPEQQFIKGEDGYSPEVTIENIDHGHSVNITDRDHPTGQSFNVMDGDSAYEQAVAGGYTGTEAQFNEELASFKELSEQAADSASRAAGAAFRAQNYERHAGDAEGAARAYADIALIRMNSADTSAQAAATTATTFTEQTVPAAVNTINEAKADALTAVGNAQTTAVSAVQTESTTQQAAIQQKGEDVLASIPSDYTKLSEDVNGDVVDIETGTLVSGYMDTATGIKRSSSSGLGVTDYIDIGDYEKIAFRRIRSTSATAASGTCFYDSNQNWIGGIVSLRSQPAAGYDDLLCVVDIPSGARYARFTGYLDTSTYGEFTVKGIKPSLPNDISNVARVPQIGNIFCVASTLPGADTFNDVVGLYDALVENFPLVMSKNTLTNGSFTNYEYVFSTGNYNTKGRRTRDAVIAKPKILITSGVHGAERSAVMSLYYFVKAMCENVYTLNDVINPVEYHIIPVVCPWGYTNNSRVNENGVNINRNFATIDWTQTATGDDYSGASAGDQIETQVVQNWLTANNDAEIFIDFHNSGYSEEISALIGLSTQAHLKAKMCYLQSVNKIVPYLKNARNLGQYNVFAYTGNTNIPGTAKGYGEEQGIMSFTLETSNNVENHKKYGTFVNAIGCEMFGATIKGMVKYVLLKDPINAAILG